MKQRWFTILAGFVLSIAGVTGQSPPVVNTAKLGPQVRAPVPPFAGVVQFGKRRTLASTYGPKGTMLVFFRSADW